MALSILLTRRRSNAGKWEVIGQRDARLKKNQGKAEAKNPQNQKTGGPSNDQVVREIPQAPSSRM
ncbi:hypothetical protein RRF57_006440 [Xylaria bambusicola]|uniref:Uncharacterized protein n=1 Tax=Xylaria bambusicola TaxID=326684 RepID=A0AAN7YYV0_9PEZI